MLDWFADVVLKRSLKRRRAQIAARDTYYATSARSFDHYRLQTIGQGEPPRRFEKCLFAVDEEYFTLVMHSRRMENAVLIPREMLCWFGRPEKYQPNHNEVWIHLDGESYWIKLELRLSLYHAQRLIRALKQIATPEQITAYRRHRPHVHYGPVEARGATQDLYGVWTVAPRQLLLYLMPAALIVFEGQQIVRRFPLEQIGSIEVMRRADAPTENGIVRFTSKPPGGSARGEVISYTLADHVEFGVNLSEAARRWLEEPPIFYGKHKDDEDDWD